MQISYDFTRIKVMFMDAQIVAGKEMLHMIINEIMKVNKVKEAKVIFNYEDAPNDFVATCYKDSEKPQSCEKALLIDLELSTDYGFNDVQRIVQHIEKTTNTKDENNFYYYLVRMVKTEQGIADIAQQVLNDVDHHIKIGLIQKGFHDDPIIFHRTIGGSMEEIT